MLRQTLYSARHPRVAPAKHVGEDLMPGPRVRPALALLPVHLVARTRQLPCPFPPSRGVLSHSPRGLIARAVSPRSRRSLAAARGSSK